MTLSPGASRAGEEPMEEETPVLRLVEESDLDLRTEEENRRFQLLRNRLFYLTKAFDPFLLAKIGMDDEFTRVWQALGWSGFASVHEAGSRLLTIQFLCTLEVDSSGCSFRVFHKKFELTWKQLSSLLGFADRCRTDLVPATKHFQKDAFWQSIASESAGRPKNSDIHNPTLRFFHKWLAMTLFPRDDIRPVRLDEMRILFAAVKKIKVSPVEVMMKQWVEYIRMAGPIECTSLVTRIVSSFFRLSDYPIAYITEDRPLVTEEALVVGHTLKHAPDGSLLFYFPDYTNEIPLPSTEYRLYSLDVLTIDLQKARPTPRQSSRRARPTEATPLQQRPMTEAEVQGEWSPAGFTPGWFQTPTGPATHWGHAGPSSVPQTGWDQFVQPGHAGTSSWHSVASEQWRPTRGQYGMSMPGTPEESTSRRSSFSGGAGYSAPRRSHSGRSHHDLSRRMGELDTQMGNLTMTTNELRQDFNTFAGGVLNWQQQADRNLARIQQQNDDIFAFLQAHGHDPNRQQ